MAWYLAQIVEYVVVVAALSRIVPESTPRWLQVVIFVGVLVGVFLLNLFVVMPKLGRSSRSEPGDQEV
jgi:hypothetical protein